MALHTENYISLYSGGGGLDLGFRLANPNARPVLYVEREFQAAALLVDHIEAELLEPAPVWSDTGTLDCEPFADRVDWVIGGPPCQPFSNAGLKLGADDPRNQWPTALGLVSNIAPRFCFFENVASTDLIWYVYEEVEPCLRALGYEVEIGIFSAEEAGATQRRERIFIMARSNDSDRRRTKDTNHARRWTPEAGRSSRKLAGTSGVRRSTGSDREREHRVRDPEKRSTAQDQQLRGVGKSGVGEGSDALAGADSESIHKSERGARPESERGSGVVGKPESSRTRFNGDDERAPNRKGNASINPSPPVGNASSKRSERGRPPRVEVISAQTRPPVFGRAGRAFPPGRTSYDEWATYLGDRPDLSPASEPGLRRGTDGLARSLDGLSRTARLRILGNGVVPQQAALACEILKARL